MRLSQHERNVIKSAILKILPDAKIMLFGSRTDDRKRGGDIDIFVESAYDIGLRQQLEILTEIECNGVTRKVDLLLKTPRKREQAIFQTARETGIVL